MALDLLTKANIRRHLGVPAAGIGTQGVTMGLRTVLQNVGNLELYMNVLQLEEEAMVRGVPCGAFMVQYGSQVGDVITVAVTVNTPSVVTRTVTYTVLQSDITSPAPWQIIANKISLVLNAANINGIIFASGIALNPLVPPQNLPPVGQVSALSLTGGTFSLAVTGPCTYVISQGTSYPQPQMVIDDGGGDPTQAIIAYGLLPICDALEQALNTAPQNASLSKVGSDSTGAATFRADEWQYRSGMLAAARFNLGVFLNYYDSPTILRGF